MLSDDDTLSSGADDKDAILWGFQQGGTHRIIQPEKLRSLAGDWKTYLKEAQGFAGREYEQHERTGRPLGNERFIEKAERLLQRELKKEKPGPKGGGQNN